MKCDYCGQENANIINTDNTFMCNNCAARAGTCYLCINSRACDFETNPSSLPKQVQKTIRQGPATLQTIIKNPDRIDITCRMNCPCFSEDFGCLRENGTCGKYEEVSLK